MTSVWNCLGYVRLLFLSKEMEIIIVNTTDGTKETISSKFSFLPQFLSSHQNLLLVFLVAVSYLIVF